MMPGALFGRSKVRETMEMNGRNGMRTLLVLLSLILLAVTNSTYGQNGIECSVDVYQTDTITGSDHLLFSDTGSFLLGTRTAAFPVVFTLNIEVTAIDTARVEFKVHVITLGQSTNTYSRNFIAEYGLPARMDGIKGKGIYRLAITPLQPTEIDTTYCMLDHTKEGVFSMAPSANINFSYLPRSLADFYWTSIRDLMESQYEQFRNMFGLTLTGKYSIYLCPCAIPSVMWDNRFGMLIDPTKSTSWAVYNSDLITAGPFLITHNALLRHWGYAPPFLSEGLGNCLSFAVYDMKKLLNDGTVPPLSEMLDTYHYLKSDPRTADLMGATFAQYLLKIHTMQTIRNLYDSADDLNLGSRMEDALGLTLSDLDADWRHWVETTTVTAAQLGTAAEESELLRDYASMLRYSEAAVAQAATGKDSLKTLRIVKRAAFFTGDYYRAAEIQQQVLDQHMSDPRQWLGLAAYRMMNGQYDEALPVLEEAVRTFPDNPGMRFNLALNCLLRGDTAAAIDHYLNGIGIGDQKSARGEHLVMLANILRTSTDSLSRSQATDYYKRATGMFQRMVSTPPVTPTSEMWLGIAWLGLGEAEAAESHLATARFLESRQFYYGMIDLWRGKTADVAGDRELAIRYYNAVVGGQSAVYHQQEAERYLETAYSQ